MQVGINYPWRDYGWDFGLAPPGWRPPGAGPRWADEIDGHLRRFQELGITVVRWFILGDGLAYGTGGDAPRIGPDDSWQFDPPALGSAIVEDFEELLWRFEIAGAGAAVPVQLLPVFIDFHFAKRGRPIGTPGWIKSGRADAIADPLTRELFFDRALEPLLAVAQAHADAIYAWDLVNEPEWITFGWHPHWWRTPPVDERDMRAFLEEGCARVRRAGFRCTIGFALRNTLLASGLADDIHQCHHYPAGRCELGPAPTPGGGPAMLGEFATAQSDLWPELPDWDQGVLNRLRLAAQQGYSLALPWSYRATDRHTAWSPDVERDIASFTRGGGEMGTVTI